MGTSYGRAGKYCEGSLSGMGLFGAEKKDKMDMTAAFTYVKKPL